MKKNKAIIYRPRYSPLHELDIKATPMDWFLAFIGSAGIILTMWAKALGKY